MIAFFDSPCFGQHSLSACIENGYVLSVTCNTCGVHLDGTAPKEGANGAVTTITHNIDDMRKIKFLNDLVEKYRTGLIQMRKLACDMEQAYNTAVK